MREAGSFYAEALALFRQCGDGQRASYCLHNMGNIARDAGDHDRAETLLRESLALADEVGDLWHRAYCLRSLGDVAEARGIWPARSCCWRKAAPFAAAWATGCRRPARSAPWLPSRGGRGTWRGGNLYGAALGLYRDVSHPMGIALCGLSLAETAAAGQDWPRAACLLSLASADPDATFTGDALARFERLHQAAQAALGDESFHAAWEQGREFSWDKCLTQLPL